MVTLLDATAVLRTSNRLVAEEKMERGSRPEKKLK
jgi:hypothetical protein